MRNSSFIAHFPYWQQQFIIQFRKMRMFGFNNRWKASAPSCAPLIPELLSNIGIGQCFKCKIFLRCVAYDSLIYVVEAAVSAFVIDSFEATGEDE